MERITVSISGMSCNHCVGRVASALKAISGLQVENVAIGSATVAYDPVATTPNDIAKAIAEAGYAVQSAGQTA